MNKMSAYEYVHAMSKAASFALRVKRAAKAEKEETPALAYLAGPSAPLGTDAAEFYQELLDAEKDRKNSTKYIASLEYDSETGPPDDDISLYRYRYNDYNPFDPEGKKKDRDWYSKPPTILELLPIRHSK